MRLAAGPQLRRLEPGAFDQAHEDIREAGWMTHSVIAVIAAFDRDAETTGGVLLEEQAERDLG